MTLILLLLVGSGQVAANYVSSEEGKNCGAEPIGEMLRSGWELEKREFIVRIDHEARVFTLGDGSRYRADLTTGIFQGDEVLLLRKRVRAEKLSAYIYNLCAGRFDAWVTPAR